MRPGAQPIAVAIARVLLHGALEMREIPRALQLELFVRSTMSEDRRGMMISFLGLKHLTSLPPASNMLHNGSSRMTARNSSYE